MRQWQSLCDSLLMCVKQAGGFLHLLAVCLTALASIYSIVLQKDAILKE
jgi:hypothetical protein